MRNKNVIYFIEKLLWKRAILIKIRSCGNLSKRVNPSWCGKWVVSEDKNMLFQKNFYQNEKSLLSYLCLLYIYGRNTKYYISFQLYVQWYHISNLKSSLMVVFIPQKSPNATSKNLLFPLPLPFPSHPFFSLFPFPFSPSPPILPPLLAI